MGSGDYMDNLMTLIMSIVRKMTGTDQKMSVSDAENALNAKSFSFHGIITDNTPNVKNIDFNKLLENGYYAIESIKLKNMPSGVQSWGTLFNLSPKIGYTLRIWVTSDSGIFVATSGTTYSNQ